MSGTGEYKEILQQFGEGLAQDVRAVAKRFAPSVELQTDDVEITILASPYINTLVDGRKPTRQNATRGNPSLQEILLDWIKDNGIVADDPETSQESLSWIFANHMHKHGDRLYQQGGGRDIFANILTSNRIEGLGSIIGTEAERVLVETTLSGLTSI